MKMKSFVTSVILLLSSLALNAAQESISASHISLIPSKDKVTVSMDLVLDSLILHRNRQVFVTPYLESKDGRRVLLPSVLINGRNMQYVYERSGLSTRLRTEYRDIAQVVARKNGTSQSLSYLADVKAESWLRRGQSALRLSVDTCGCGVDLGSGESSPLQSFDLNPAGEMLLTYVTPPVTELPVVAHEGRARVQFEVDSITLHTQPYVCRSGQRIDNRQQLAIIEDSIRYALSDPNVEIAAINVCGYASPESPYVHNDYLATHRSKALATYLAERHQLPQDRCTFSSVPENWEEFRQMTLDAQDITEEQRADLLALIDAPVYGPSDYDARERELKSSPRFARLYRTKILPVWFPLLRCTKFVINTRLRPMPDEQLAEIIHSRPEMLSLNQMFRVARLYPEGSDAFISTIRIALRYYADDPVANANAAIASIKAGRYEEAAALLSKAGSLPEAENARGVLATFQGDYEAALRHFNQAGTLPEAQKNKVLLGEGD